MTPAKQFYDVLVVGDYCLDLIFAGLPSQPVIGEEIVSNQFAMIPGGTYNSVVAMHRLGIKVGWAADFGNDSFSKFVLEKAKEEKLDTSLFIHHPYSLQKITVALSYPHDRAFIAYYDPEKTIPAGFKTLQKVQSNIIYIPGLYHGFGMEIGNLVTKAKGMKIFMDGNHSEDISLKSKQIRKAIQAVDVFLPNASEVRRLTRVSNLTEGMRILAEMTKILVVKDGAQGAHAYSQGKEVHVHAMNIKPVETTGAGDCFDAGFIKGWLSGKDLEVCLQWGNIAGGLSTLGLGGTARKVVFKDLEAYAQRIYA